MTKTTWHKGPPPSLGWWPASTAENANMLRWWNGKRWSVAVGSDYTAKEVKSLSSIAASMGGIKWTERPASWPERSKT